jgi:hypothetical protein
MIPAMFIHFDAERPSDSPFIERVWSCHSESGGPFLAIASTHWEFVVSRVAGEIMFTLHGPETRPREVHCPADGERFAIRFKAGTFMPGLPVSRLIDGNDVHLPRAFRNRFRLDGSAFEIPDFANAETFVGKLLYICGRARQCWAPSWSRPTWATHVRLGNPLFSHVLFGVYVGVLMWVGLLLREPRLRALLPGGA